jgi:hypothetical protein
MNILRKAVSLLLAAFAFLTIQFSQPALADNTVLSPEGIYYKGTPDDGAYKNLKQNDYSSGNKNLVGNNSDTEYNKTKVDDGSPTGNQAKSKLQGSGSNSGTVTSPEGVYYKGVPDDDIHRGLREQSYDNAINDNSNSGGNIIEKLKETAETVTEKLNLNEETPRATKEFLRSTEKEVGKAVEPVTGTRSGYYQLP